VLRSSGVCSPITRCKLTAGGAEPDGGGHHRIPAQLPTTNRLSAADTICWWQWLRAAQPVTDGYSDAVLVMAKAAAALMAMRLVAMRLVTAGNPAYLWHRRVNTEGNPAYLWHRRVNTVGNPAYLWHRRVNTTGTLAAGLRHSPGLLCVQDLPNQL